MAVTFGAQSYCSNAENATSSVVGRTIHGMSHNRIAGWAGIAFFVLSGIIVAVASFWPPLGAGAGEIVTWYRAHRMPFLVGNYLAAVAAVPSFIQIAYLCMMVRRAEGE